MALRKFSIKASVFFTSAEYTSLPTMGQKGTFVPSSCDTASARAVLPVPGPPASSTARPDIFFARIRSTTTPQACRLANVRNKRSIHGKILWKQTYLTGGSLPDETCRILFGIAIRSQSKTLDVCMGCCAVLARVALDLADLHHDGERVGHQRSWDDCKSTEELLLMLFR